MIELKNVKTILEKIANSPDAEFEQSFFQLAYERLQEKLHNLLPFLVGFEIVNKNDEGTKALGVFGFKSNNGQMLFVPAFFVNGTVKGIDIIYSKNNEQFYPLNEDFAELFLKDEVTGLGDKSKENTNDINSKMSPINLQALIKPPKTASINHTSLMDFVTDGDVHVKQAFFKFFSEDEKFCESVLRFYPLDKVAKALVLPQVKTVEREADIEVYKFGHDLSSLPEDKKLEAINKGYTILDKRAEEQKSKIGLFKYTETFINPSESGFYSYITQRGNLRYSLVLVSPLPLREHFSNRESIVIDLDSSKQGRAYTVDHDKLFAKGKYQIKDFSTVHDMMQEPAEAKPSFSESYILINQNLKCTEPLRIVANYKTDEGVRIIEVEPDGYCVSKANNSYFSDKPRKAGRLIKLILTKKTGDKLEYRGNTILVPKGFKLLNLNFKSSSSLFVGSNQTDKTVDDYTANTPGTLNDLNAALRADSIFPFIVNSNGSEYFVSVGTKKKKYDNPMKAKIGMVVDFGVIEKDAEELIDSINYTSSKEGQIKLAYTGEQFFSLRDPQMYANALGQPTQDGENGYTQEMPRTEQYSNDPTSIGRAVMPEIEGTSAAIQNANQMAEAGQKQIFDTQSIATLSKYVSPQTKTMTYMPEFISCLDKLGRMLFLTHWETEKFEEMYGRSEMPDLVELLTNVFKNLGDLVIYLKRKSPELSINMAESDGVT